MSHGKIISEHEIQCQIIDWLKIKRYFFFRFNSGVMQGSYKGKRSFVRFGVVGAPDIFVIHHGRIIGLEVKSSKGFQSQAQILFGNELVKAGGYYFVVRSLEEAITALLGRQGND